MGRPRKNFSKGSLKNLACKCGKVHKVADETQEVVCDTCYLKLKPIDCTKDVLNEFNKKMAKDPINKTLSEMDGLLEKKVKRGRGRPRKSEKKGNTMDNAEKKSDVKGGSGKRGRKATVGAAVLGFIKEQKGDVQFNDILKVYSAEREKMGKKGSDDVEVRNCHSTLYVMARDGKIREVTKKSVYAAI